MRIMIVGAGDIGMPIIHYLSERGHLLTVIEKSEERCKHIAEHADAAIFQGEGSEKELWRNLEAEKMDLLFTLTNNDQTNIAVCEIAKRVYGIPFVIARAHQPENLAVMKKAGADVAICPSLETQRLFLNAFEGVTVETLIAFDTQKFKAVIVTIPHDGQVIGKTIQEIDIPENCRISSVIRNGSFEFPSENFVLKGGDKALLLGSKTSVETIVEKLRATEMT